MNILIIHQNYLRKGESGISRFNQFAKYWSNTGHKVTVIAGTAHHLTGEAGREDYKRKLFVKEQDGDVKVIRTYVSKGYHKSFLTRLMSFLTFLVSSTIAAIFSGKQDVVLATSPPLFVGITGYLVSFFKRIPLIFEVRDLWPDFAVDSGVLKNKAIIKLSYALESFIYQKADLINVLTPAFKKVLEQEKNVSLEKIVYIPNGADFDLLFPGEKNNWVRKKYNWENKFVVLYVGAHGLANYLTLVLDAAKTMLNYKDIVFVLIGDGMLKPKLVSRAKKENLTNVVFIDPVPKEKIGEYINAADVCTAILQKIYNTTYPNKVFDYMSCAKPIVLPIDGAIRKVVKQANSGIYVEPENAKEFKKAVLKLYFDRELLDLYGKNGYQYVKDNFSRERLARKYEEIIKNLVDLGK